MKKRDELLEEARDFFGYAVDQNDIKFQQMVAWKEEQQKIAKRRMRREKRDNTIAQQVAQLSAELNASKE